MIIPAERLLRVNKAWLADGERVVKDRLPGAFKRLVNVVPNLSDGIGQLRTGYQPFNSTNGGINIGAASDSFNPDYITEILHVHPIQSPQNTNLYLLFQNDAVVSSSGSSTTATGKRVAIYPDWYNNALTTPYARFVDIAESFVSGDGLDRNGNAVAADTFVYDAGKQIIGYSAANLVRAGFEMTIDNYYKGWIVYNRTRSNYAIVQDYQVDGSLNAIITFIENVHNFGGATTDNLGWTTTDVLVWIRNFHDNPYDATSFPTGFKPSYADDKANPPVSNVQNSIVRFSGGQNSDLNFRGVHITPKLVRTFFPAITAARKLEFAKCYVSERELKQPVLANLLRTSQYVNCQDGTGATEEIVPSATGVVVNPVLLTLTGATTYHEAVDEGSTPNDADYFTNTWQPGPPLTNGVQLMLPFPTKKIDREGTTTVNVRYKIENNAGGVNQTLSVNAKDGTGASFGIGAVTTLDSAGIQTLTFTFSNAVIDPETWYLWVYFGIGSVPLTLPYTTIYDVWCVADVLTEDILEPDKTYWVGIAPIYDGYQIGNLIGVETTTDYNVVTGQWTYNYLRANSTTQGVLKVNFRLSLARLNKRITGYAVYCAIDEGQTTVRKAAYQFVKWVSIVENDGFANDWTFDDATGTFNLILTIGGPDIAAIGNVFETDAGYAPSATDTMYAYSTEEIVSGRRLLANAYVYGESVIDRANIFTNPVGANPSINSGIVQPDVFSNESGIYRLRVDPLTGSKINAIVPVGIDEFLILKDRGAILGRIVIVSDVPDITQTILSRDVGAATVNGYAKDDDGIVYFNGYDDIYAYKNNELRPLIERPDKNDWLYTYQEVLTAAQKESSTIFYLPEIKSVMFFFGVTAGLSDYSGTQFLFHRGLWSEVSYCNYDAGGAGLTDYNLVPRLSMRWHTQLNNGHVLAVSTESTKGYYRMSWGYSAGNYDLIYKDYTSIGEAVGVSPYFDTGLLLMGEESSDITLRKVVVNRTFTNKTLAGTLDITIKNDRAVGLLKQAISASDDRVTCRFAPTTVRKGQAWQMIFNQAAWNKERITAGQYQINSVEYFGRKTPRVRSTGK